MEKILENISNKYWQVIVFIIVFVGYITFSFYMGINGFSFVDINIRQVIGLGLLSGMSIIWILFLCLNQVMKLNISALFIISFIPLFLFKLISSIDYDKNILFLIPTLLIVAVFITTSLSEEHTYKKDNGEFAKDTLFDKILIPTAGIILLVTLFEVSLVALFLLNIYYLYIFNKYTHMKIGHKIMLIVLFVFIQPLLTAIIINQNGFSLANFDKQHISIEQNNKKVKGLLIYQNEQSFFIHENNNSIIILKNNIDNKILFKQYKYKNNTILNIMNDYFQNSINKEHNNTLEEEQG